MRRNTQNALVGVALATFFLGAAQSEPLTPPAGPVAGTGPTQIFELPFTISQPGSYIVARDLTGVAARNGININIDGVTLDLNGFTLHGVPGSLNGIALGGFRQNVVIRNGAVRDWGGDGILGQIDVGRIERISASFNAGWGIRNVSSAFSTHIVSCETFFNGSGGAGGGIRVGSNAVITGCVARSNTGPGVSGVSNVTIEDTVSAVNSLAGFALGDTAVVRGCTAAANFGGGFVLGPGAVVSNCTATNVLPPLLAQASRPDFDDRDAQRLLATTSGPQAPPSPRPDLVDPFANYVNPVVIDERTGEIIPGLVSFGAGTEGVFLGTDGFRLGIGSLIEGCTAYANTDDGIAVGWGSIVINCSAMLNLGDGIIADDDSTVLGCTSRSNIGAGIIVDAGGVVRDCTVNTNVGDGIVAGKSVTIFGNKVRENGGDGIVVNFTGCRVDSNHVASNAGDGIRLNASFTVVVRNHLELNNINDIPGTNTMIGPINDLTNPWTNFSL